VRVGTEITYCFVARSGGAPSERLAISPRITPAAPSCITLRGVYTGAATLDVTAGGLTKTFAVIILRAR
jgi:hypothetical protein